MSFALDVNVLLYASDSASPLHDRAHRFLEACAAGSEIVYLAWPTVMAYLRIATHGAIFAKLLSPQDAMQNIEGLLALPQVRTLGEGEGFWNAFRRTASDIPARGNLVHEMVATTASRALRCRNDRFHQCAEGGQPAGRPNNPRPHPP